MRRENKNATVFRRSTIYPVNLKGREGPVQKKGKKE